MNNLRQIFRLAPVIILFLLQSCSGAKNMQSDPVSTGNWQETPLFVDGDESDWQQPLSFNDTKLGIAYTVTNDTANLYIRLIATNDETISRIIYGGLTVYLNNHGVKETAGAAGISFPTGNMKRQKNNLLNDRAGYRESKRVAVDAVQDYALFGFPNSKTQENYDLSRANPEGIRVQIGLNRSGALVYEASIPLTAFLGKNDILNMGRRSLAVGWVLEPLPPDMIQSGNRGGGVSIGGGIGMGSFGGGSGMGISIGSGSLGRIGGGRQAKPIKIWKELLLAKAPANKA